MIINELTLTFFQKSFGIWDAVLLVFGLLVFVGMIYGAYRAIMNLQKENDKARLMQEKILPEFFSKFGKVISIEAEKTDRLIKLERYGTFFEIKVRSFSSESDELITEIRCQLPNLREQFYIQHKTSFPSSLLKNPSGCPEVKLTMPEEFIFHSLNPQFLANLVAKDNIRNEIYKYQRKFSRQFIVFFADRILTVAWVRGLDDGSEKVSFSLYDSWENESPEDEVKRLGQICQTAVVFYDELAKNQQEAAK